MPELLRWLRYRLLTLLHLRRWQAAAADVSRFITLILPYVASDDIEAGLKEAAEKQFAQMKRRVAWGSRAFRVPTSVELLFVVKTTMSLRQAIQVGGGNITHESCCLRHKA